MTPEQITRAKGMLSCIDVESLEESYISVSPDVSPEEIEYHHKTTPNADELRAYYIEQLQLFMEVGLYTEEHIKEDFGIVL